MHMHIEHSVQQAANSVSKLSALVDQQATAMGSRQITDRCLPWAVRQILNRRPPVLSH